MKRKKKQTPEAAESGLLQMMTVSLFIILLAFFILLNAFAVPDQLRRREAIGSIRSAFGFLSGGYSVMEWEDTPRPPIDSDSLQAGSLDFTFLGKGVTDFESIADQIGVQSRRDGTVLRLPAHILFERHQTQLKPSARTLLDNLAGLLQDKPYPVEISGHTDNRPIHQFSTMTNREISALRALAVRNYLHQSGKIGEKRLTAIGWGAQHPVFSNQTLRGRRQNRRVEFLFVHRPEDSPSGGFTFKNFFFKALE